MKLGLVNQVIKLTKTLTIVQAQRPASTVDDRLRLILRYKYIASNLEDILHNAKNKVPV